VFNLATGSRSCNWLLKCESCRLCAQEKIKIEEEVEGEPASESVGTPTLLSWLREEDDSENTIFFKKSGYWYSVEAQDLRYLEISDDNSDKPTIACRLIAGQGFL